MNAHQCMDLRPLQERFVGVDAGKDVYWCQKGHQQAILPC